MDEVVDLVEGALLLLDDLGLPALLLEFALVVAQTQAQVKASAAMSTHSTQLPHQPHRPVHKEHTIRHHNQCEEHPPRFRRQRDWIIIFHLQSLLVSKSGELEDREAWKKKPA